MEEILSNFKAGIEEGVKASRIKTLEDIIEDLQSKLEDAKKAIKAINQPTESEEKELPF